MPGAEIASREAARGAENAATDLGRLPDFRNEPFTDFRRAENVERFVAGVAAARAELGREYPNLVGWELRERRAARQFASVNPSRPEEVVGRHQEGDAALAEEAVTAAATMYECWGRSRADKRIQILLRVAALLRARKAEYSAWLTLETGKTFPEADADVGETIDFAEYYAREAVRLFLRPPAVPQLPGERDELRYLPLGVVGVIPPWNFPSAIMGGMTMAALVCGNTVVLKPSSDAATIAARFLGLLEEAGLPKGVVNLVTGGGAEVGGALVADPRTRMIAFTGSKAVGLEIAARSAVTPAGQRWIKRAILEMGGKDAILVAGDADLPAAVEGVTASAFGYQGQKCSACSRAIVEESLYDRFLAALVERAGRLRVGPAEDPASDLGPVINAGARDKILDYIAIGRREGRLVLGGGKPDGAMGNGYFIAPTIFADVDAKARIAQEEIFGPVLAVIRCRDFEHGLALANDSEYGLTGAVYSRDEAKLERAVAEFHVGNLYLNRKCTGAMVGSHPFGGFNMSGTDSKAGGPDYLLLFTQAQAVARRLP